MKKTNVGLLIIMQRLLFLLAVTIFSVSAFAVTPQSGWYWNPSESGRGFNIEIQGTTLFVAGFMYDAAGHPMWVISGGPMSSASTYSGVAYITDDGQPLGGAYRPAVLTPFGNASITFSTDTDATIDVNGNAFSITRDWFGISPPTGPPPVSTTPEGMWVGSTSTGETIVGIVLDNLSYYFLYTAPGTTSIAGVVQGSGIGSNGQISSSNAKDFNIQGYGVRSATITGSYSARGSMSGTFSSSLGSQTFTATYDSRYETPAAVSVAAGSYFGSVASSAGIQSIAFSVSSGGVIGGSVSGCSFSGHVSPHSNVNAFDLSVTSGGGPCVFGTSTLYGIAYYDAASQTIYAAAPNAARTDGFVLVGHK